MLNVEPKRSLPSFRRWLTKVHLDLLTIHSKISLWAAYYPEELSTFEKFVIVLEDRRFFNHGGVDLLASLREVYKWLLADKHGGASTIDMQLVRTATGYREQTIRRKLYEMFLASLLQFRYSKVVILRSYLNIAYFGWHLRGADSAARALFHVSSDELDQRQAAQLACLLVYPMPRVPSPHWEKKVLRRTNHIEAFYIRHKQRFDQIAS